MTGSDRYPGWHPDDWEGATVRVEADGRAAVRVTSHGHWQWCKQSQLRRPLGARDRMDSRLARQPRRSRAGRRRDGRLAPPGLPAGRSFRYRRQMPGSGLRERTSSAEGIRLVPLEGVDVAATGGSIPGISPPWEKDAYANPESSGS